MIEINLSLSDFSEFLMKKLKVEFELGHIVMLEKFFESKGIKIYWDE